MNLTAMIMMTLIGSVVTGPALAADPGQVFGLHSVRRRHRIERGPDHRGDDINYRPDRRGERVLNRIARRH